MYLLVSIQELEASLMAQRVKNLPCNVGDMDLISGSRRSPGEENGNPLQYSGLENSMDRGYSPWSHKESDMTEQLTLTHKRASLMTSHQIQFCATYQRDYWFDAMIVTETHCSILCVRVNYRSAVFDSLQPLWSVACKAPLSLEFSNLEYWSGLSFPSPGNLSHLGIRPTSPESHMLIGRFFTTWDSITIYIYIYIQNNMSHFELLVA